jgi:acyl-CoA dehydrogenase
MIWTVSRDESSQLHHDLRAGVRALCREFPDTYWRDLDARRAYPDAFVKALTEAGYLAALIPEEFGGSGLGLAEASIILEEINRSGANSGACHAQMYTMGTLLRHGSDAQKREYLPKIASGEIRLQAFGVSEPTTGSDTTQLKTTAERRGDRYIIRGQKIWISRAEHSDLLLLIARTTPVAEVKKRTEGLSVLLVDMRQAVGHGLTIRPIRTMMNHATTELFFDDLDVPADTLIGEEGKGFRYLIDGLNAERILIAAECVGDGRWFVDRATRYARDRVVFGRPIGQNQGIQFPIARAHVNVEAADLMRIRAAELFDRGDACGSEANMAKLLAADASWEAANVAVQTYGGFGFAEDFDIERKFRETKLYQIAPISTNMILNYIGEHVLGLPRSY